MGSGGRTCSDELRKRRERVCLRELVEQYAADLHSLLRTYKIAGSPARRERLRRFHQEWLVRLERIVPEGQGAEEQTDHVLLTLHVRQALQDLQREEREAIETAPLLAFSGIVFDLVESWRRKEPLNAQEAARLLDCLAKEVRTIQQNLERHPDTGTNAIIADRAAQALAEVRAGLREWFAFYDGYDPLFTWWAEQPYHEADSTLERYGVYLSETIAQRHEGRDAPIIGTPIGRDALVEDLQTAMIAYTPEELVDIANREMAWCEREMLRAAQDMGYRSDWHEALETVKNLYVPPGEQPALIYRLAAEGIEFAETHDLVTIPDLAKETWRSEMMSAERQRINPFFLGGEVIRISYPTPTMTYEERMMSMRGNNPYFSRSTVFHELLPGHYLQQFMNARFHPYRRLFHNAFWTEGMAFYWEMLFWGLGFNETPEQRIGMLFWRMHRSARVIYTLGIHLGTMTPQDAVDLLVQRVGHELDNARGEVRRLFEGHYGPLYQCAYLVGALEFRALYKEFVTSGRMTARAFHDAILEQGQMPLEVLRGILAGSVPHADMKPSWRFYETVAAPLDA